MKKQLEIGIIGLGAMGPSHAKTCASLPDVHLKAISDISPERLKTVAADLNVQEQYQDGFEMIEKANLDAVIIALPNHLHAKFSIKALQNGLHVLVEKPIATNVAEAEAIIKASCEANKTLMINFNQRFKPLHLAARDIIATGKLGEIYYAKTKWLRRKGIPWWYEAGGKGALSTEIAGGGPLIDLGIHQLDLALSMMGFPEVVSVDGTTFYGLGKKQGELKKINYALEDAGVALIRFKNNQMLFLEASWTMHCKNKDVQETILYGDKGGMRLADTVEIYFEQDGIQMDSTITKYDGAKEGDLVGHFCRVVQGKETQIISGEQALLGLRILKAVYESAKTGKTVYFD